MSISTIAISLIIIDVILIAAALIYLYFSQREIRNLEKECWKPLDPKPDQVQQVDPKPDQAKNDIYDGFVGITARQQVKMIGDFDKLVLAQAQKSFSFAVIYSIAGILFFFTFLFLRQPQDPPLISAVGSVLLELLAGANFYLYGRASRQMAQCHARLFKAQNFLLAISVCKDFTELKREETCAQIALIIANYSENMSETSQDERKNLRSGTKDKNIHASQHSSLHDLAVH